MVILNNELIKKIEKFKSKILQMIPSKISELENDEGYITSNNNIFSKISDIKDNLTSTDTNKPLSAKQGYILNNSKVNISDIQNTLLSQSTDKPLSAKQGNEILFNYYSLEKMPVTVNYTDETTDEINLLTNIADSPNLMKVVVIFEEGFEEDYESYFGESFDYLEIILRKNNTIIPPEEGILTHKVTWQENWVKVFDLSEYDESYQNQVWTIANKPPESTPDFNIEVSKYQRDKIIIFYVTYTYSEEDYEFFDDMETPTSP